MTTQIYDPPIPYIGAIISKFTPGRMIRIQGIVPGIAYRFNVNLQCGSQTLPQDDVALNISVRILDGYIVLNSLRHGIWGNEQRSTNLPIKRAQPFEIVIMCDLDQYKITINGQHYCEFPQEIRCNRISHLSIDGDVSIIQISYESSTPSAPVDITAPPLERAMDDFELIDSGGTRVGTNVPDFSQPPSYDAVVAAGPPYPTNVSKGMPQPSSPYLTSIAGGLPQSGPPYPITHPGEMPQPTTTIIPLNTRSPFRPPSPPPGAPIPLNAPNSPYKPVDTNLICLKCCFGIVGAVIIVILIIVLKVGNNQRRYNNI